MSPTVFREGPYQFFFFSREESRMHVHVYTTEGEAKYWIEPNIELAQNHGIARHELGRIQKLIEEHIDEIRQAWQRHFGA